MIFDIFKGIDLNFNILIDKEEYIAGEKVNGTLTLTTNKGFKARELRLVSEGDEKTSIQITESSGTSSNTSTSNTTRTYNESNIFFSTDLSDLLKNLGDNILEDGSIEVNARTKKEIPFEFDIPKDVLPSYKGKHSTISYLVKATADRPKRIDVNKKISFIVSNSNSRGLSSQSADKPSLDINSTIADNTLNYINSENVREPDNRRNGLSPFFGKGSSYITSSGFGISIDISKLRAKSRDKFLKEGTGAKLDLGTEARMYARGDRIKG